MSSSAGTCSMTNVWRADSAMLPRQVQDVVGFRESLARLVSTVLTYLLSCWEQVTALCTVVVIFYRLRALGVRMIPPRHLHVRESGYLGEGSFGKVFIGRLHGEKVAIKTLIAQEGTSRIALLKSFLHEVEMMNGHSHSNVISCKGMCLAGNSLHMVMDFCPKGSLYTLLRSVDFQSKPWAFKVKLAFGIAKGMSFLHSQAIVHCDLKSPNVVLKEDYTTVIADFGMASLGPARNNKSRNAMWLAPEVACEGKEATTKSDVYSFAIIMWEILTGKIPWGGEHYCGDEHYRAIMGMLHKQRPQVSQEVLDRCEGYIGAKEYIALMQSCWQEDPEDRPNFEQVMNRLRGILWRAAGPLTFGQYRSLTYQEPALKSPWFGFFIKWLISSG